MLCFFKHAHDTASATPCIKYFHEIRSGDAEKKGTPASPALKALPDAENPESYSVWCMTVVYSTDLQSPEVVGASVRKSAQNTRKTGM